MDQVTFSLIGIIKIFHDIKRVFIVLMLVAATSSATPETTSEPPPPRKTGPKMNPPMAIVLTCLLTAFLLICIFLFYFRRCVNHQLTLASTVGNRGERRSVKLVEACGLNPAVIATFTTFTYSTAIEQHTLECAVCLIEFDDNEVLRLLPECNHVFHCTCIDAWLASHVTWPVCRVSLVPKPNRLNPDTESSRGQNELIKGHVSVEVFDLKHGLTPVRELQLHRCYSTGHLSVEPCAENLKESSLEKSLKSASTNFVTGSDYFNYERFGQERRPSERKLSIARSFNSRGDPDFVEEESMRKSQRFIMFVKSIILAQ